MGLCRSELVSKGAQGSWRRYGGDSWKEDVVFSGKARSF